MVEALLAFVEICWRSLPIARRIGRTCRRRWSKMFVELARRTIVARRATRPVRALLISATAVPVLKVRAAPIPTFWNGMSHLLLA